MKKVLLIILLLVPITIKADYSVSNYKIDITVLKNGDVEVIEAFKLDGEYNGFERIINYKGNFDSYRGDFLKSADINLYNIEDVVLNEVRGINFENDLNILTYKETGDLFKKSNDAKKGDYGLYTLKETKNGYTYKIYNSSKMNKAFYLNYILEDMVIIHNDIAELFYYTEINEEIDNLEIYIHIPNNQNKLKIWFHNVSYDMDIIDSENVVLKINEFDNIIDFRIIFDNDIVKTNKTNNEEVLTKIENIEENFIHFSEPADDKYESEKQRVYELVTKVENTKTRNDYEIAKQGVEGLNKDDKLRTELLVRLIDVESQVERKETIITFTLFGVLGVWVIGLMVIFYEFYKKYSKKNEYYEKILEDKDYKPYIIGYLIKRKVDYNELIATLLYMIYKKNISINKKNKGYILEKNDIKDLDVSDERLLKLIFNDKNIISTNELKKYVNNNYEKFINCYSNWLNSTMDIIHHTKLFENLIVIKIVGIVYCIIGIILSIMLYRNIYIRISIIILSLFSILLFLLIYKRTTKGKFIYEKFNKLKKNLYKEVPSKEDLEFSLIYSIIFGNFSKIEKNILLNIDTLDNKKYYMELLKMYKCLNVELSSLINKAYKRKKDSTA